MHSPSYGFQNPEGLKGCHECGASRWIPYALRLLGGIARRLNLLAIGPAEGHSHQARAELSAASVLYRARGITWRLPQAKAALAQVEGR
jgi:hypothetical protein